MRSCAICGRDCASYCTRCGWNMEEKHMDEGVFYLAPGGSSSLVYSLKPSEESFYPLVNDTEIVVRGPQHRATALSILDHLNGKLGRH